MRMEHAYRKCGSRGMPRFEWCLLLDNSGSMASKATAVKEAVTVVMEVLRRMEQPFAVVRFGRKCDQKVLGIVLDNMSCWVIKLLSCILRSGRVRHGGLQRLAMLYKWWCMASQEKCQKDSSTSHTPETKALV